MRRKHIGKLKPRYKFILNPYSETRLTKCPSCQKPTHPRKFALFIIIREWGPLAMGKTCRYCSKCELIIVHQNELDAELADKFQTLGPQFIGNDYIVMGTIDKKVWERGLATQTSNLETVLQHTADFKHVLELNYQPAGWYPADRSK